MKHITWAAAAVVTGLLTIAGTAGLAGASSSQPGGGIIHVWAPQSSALKGRVVITGAVADYGTTLNIDKAGKPDPDGGYVKVTLRHGSFEVNATPLNNALDHQRPVINRITCSLFLSGTGRARLMAGTGAYTGINGSLTVTAMTGEVARQVKSGQCDDSPDATPQASYTALWGAGRIAF